MKKKSLAHALINIKQILNEIGLSLNETTVECKDWHGKETFECVKSD